jgi:tRNA(adenine34) deaminase
MIRAFAVAARDMTDENTAFMRIALQEARESLETGEIPVGAVIAKDGAVIARAHNENRASRNPVKHAEILAIERAAALLQNERLTGCDLYVTKEPCAMCAGAIVHARLRRVYIAAEDPKYGACGSVLTVCGHPRLNHEPEVTFGILREEAAALLTGFFARLRAGGAPSDQ